MMSKISQPILYITNYKNLFFSVLSKGFSKQDYTPNDETVEEAAARDEEEAATML